MSRAIRLSDEQIEQFAEKFKEELQKGILSEEEIKYRIIPPKSKERAVIFFSEKAWLKQTYLLDTCDKEVAWHGVVERIEKDGANAYLISDIVVYPQTVSSAYVDMDTSKYSRWIQEHEEAGDERFSSLRMQAHSHVNMSVTPSGKDIQHQMDIVNYLGGDSFYIFMIYNKRRDRYVRVFDFAKNLVFENADVDTYILGLEGFPDEVKKNVVERSYVYTPQNGGSTYNSQDYWRKNELKKEESRIEPKKEEPKKELPASKPIIKFPVANNEGSDWCEENEDIYMRGM